MRSLLLGFFVALGCTAAVFAAPRLRIGVETADNPISFVDAAGRPTGFTAALLEEMGRAGLTDYEIVARPWTVLAREFHAGQIDVLANVALTAERADEMDFSISHASVHGIVFSRRDRPPILRTADFAGKTIAALSGSIAYANAQAHPEWGAKIEAITDPQAAMDATARGEFDAVLLIYGLEGKYITNTHNLRREFVDDIVHHFRFAVHKGDSAALARLNDALATVRHKGAFDRIYDRWIGPIEPHPIRLADLRPYALALSLGALALTAIFWWQRYMLTKVSRHARALRESEERFHGLVDGAFEGWIIHQEGRIALVNPSFAATFGYTPEALIGRPVLDLISPDCHAEYLANYPAVGPAIRRTTAVRRDGTCFPVETSCRECTLDGKPARIAAVRDLTAQHQAAADQLVLSKLESTGILAGGIAHDFNNLLAVQVLNVDLVLLTEPLGAEGRRYLQNAKTAAHSAHLLTQQLITFSRGEAAVRQPTHLPALLKQAAPPALAGSTVRAEISTAADLSPVEINAAQIERVIGQIVMNAREAMPTGGVLTIRAENLTLHPGEIPLLAAGRYVRIDFTDEGHGIPADVLPKIFDPYFSTKARGTQKGMGLGLTISHTIVHQHGGALTVDSRVNIGTTFHLYLPVTDKPVAITPAAPPPSPRRPAHILVMDDEPAMRDTVRAALVHEGYTVEVTADGRAALDCYARARAAGQPFDLVILDLTVRGGMGGLETMQSLRSLYPDIKAIVMSGYANATILRDYTQHGFKGALAKPFTLESLRDILPPILES